MDNGQPGQTYSPPCTSIDGDLLPLGLVSSVVYDEEKVVGAGGEGLVFEKDDKDKTNQVRVRGVDWSPCFATGLLV